MCTVDCDEKERLEMSRALVRAVVRRRTRVLVVEVLAACSRREVGLLGGIS